MFLLSWPVVKVRLPRKRQQSQAWVWMPHPHTPTALHPTLPSLSLPPSVTPALLPLPSCCAFSSQRHTLQSPHPYVYTLTAQTAESHLSTNIWNFSVKYFSGTYSPLPPPLQPRKKKIESFGCEVCRSPQLSCECGCDSVYSLCLCASFCFVK